MQAQTLRFLTVKISLQREREGEEGEEGEGGRERLSKNSLFG